MASDNTSSMEIDSYSWSESDLKLIQKRKKYHQDMVEFYEDLEKYGPQLNIATVEIAPKKPREFLPTTSKQTCKNLVDKDLHDLSLKRVSYRLRYNDLSLKRVSYRIYRAIALYRD